MREHVKDKYLNILNWSYLSSKNVLIENVMTYNIVPL